MKHKHKLTLMRISNAYDFIPTNANVDLLMISNRDDVVIFSNYRLQLSLSHTTYSFELVMIMQSTLDDFQKICVVEFMANIIALIIHEPTQIIKSSMRFCTGQNDSIKIVAEKGE